MNNIYKVIWSKAKNCYVVASEIAKSHTKSASGSEKMGGYGKRALLALAAASAIFCGGLVNVGASVQSETISAGTTSNRVLTVDNTDDAAQLNKVISAAREDKLVTKDNIGGQLTDYAKASDLSAKADATELNAKANTDLSNLTADGENKIKETMSADMAKKANTDTVTALEGRVEGVEGKVTALETKVGDASSGLVKDVAALETKVGDASSGLVKDVAALETKVGDASNGLVKDVTTLKTTVGDASNGLVKDVNDLNTALGNKANQTDLEDATKRITVNESNITALQTKTQKIDYDVANETTSINGMKVGQRVDMGGKDLTHVGAINGTKIGTKVDGTYIHQGSSIWENMKNVDTQVGINTTAIATLDTKVGTVNNGTYLDSSKSVGENLNKLNDGLVQEVADRKAADTVLSGRIDANANTIAKVNQELVNTNNHFNTELRKTNDHFNAELGKTNAALQEEGKARAEADAKINTKIGNIDDTRTEYVKNANSISQNLTTLDEKLQNTNDRTGGIKRNTEDTQTTIEDSVKVDNQGNVKDVKNLGAETITTTGNATIGGTLGVNGATTLGGKLTAKDNAKFEKNVTVQKDLTVDGKLNVDKISMKNNELKNGKKHDSATTITADEISNLAKVTEQGNTTESQFTHNEKGTFNYAKDEKSTGEWKRATSNVTADGVSNKMTDSDGNTHTYYQTATESKEQLVNGDKSKSNFEKKTAEGNTISITEKDADGNLKSSLTNTQTVNGEKTSVTNEDSSSTINQGADQIRYNVTSKDENKTSSSIEVKADGITNTSKDGTITNTAKNVTNEGTESVTNKVGTNEVKVSQDGVDINVDADKTIKESVGADTSRTMTDGRIIDKAGDMTVTTDKTTGTTFGNGTPNDTTVINGGTIGTNKVNANETNTKKLTAGADDGANGGRLTVDADGVKGSYKSDTYTSKSYILANTLKSGVDNGKEPTDADFVGSRTDHYMDGDKAKLDETVKDADGSNVTNKTSTGTATTITDGNGNISATIQNAKNLAGSVTNGTETGVSGIHANDDGSVSIDSAVAGGSSISTINQKKDSITSQVTDGTTITKTEQGTKDITNTATAGTITNDAKDIVNKAQDTITNTAGTSITNQVKDSKVTTDVDGTTFENKTAAVSDGGTTTTKINGNHINTGRVDANELGVSDKDGANTADLSVKAGEGVKASAGNGTTTGSLDVKADEVSSSVKDASGKGSTFKQRIDKIMMESKDVSITAEETLTNEAKVITNKASEVINNEAININNTATGIIKSKASEIQNQADRLISNKVGENTWENMEDGKITTSIKNGTKQNLTQSDAEKTEHSVVNGSNSTVNKQTSEEITDAVTNGTTTNVTQNTATSSNNTIADKNGNANTVISTVDGTSFINSKAAAPVTGASGAGTAVNTTIKGNTITTGKVTMDYAEVMKDLGVHGNANITGNTTTGSLEVTSTSTLKGDVTMESNATVKNNLTVEGTTKTKTLNVTENATVGGTLDVTGKATFQNDVDITGNVKANSYKVGDKTYIDENGIHANGQKITDVADGSISEGSKDAVNGGQLYNVKNDLEGKVNKVGANAAAMANLHPMEFDPDSKWNIAAAIGNYGSETAAALGAFYRPNDDVMVNLSTTFGTGENMVGGGVSVRLGKGGNKLSREENNALKAQVDDLTARMDALLSVLNPNMSKDFPDVPENHWAYEAVSRLAGNDIVQGYPDGEFHGERTMTRYEMAEIIYNALSRGAEAEKELVEEFKPELQAMAASEKATAERAEG